MNNQSPITISNRALLSIGARTQISDFPPGDDSVEAQACAALFQPTFESLARTAQWNCLRNQVTLSLLAAAQGTPENPNGNPPLPPMPWLYEYAYPIDCLDIRWIVPSYPNADISTIPLTTIDNNSPTLIPTAGQIKYAVSYSTDGSGNPITVILTNQCQAQAVYTINQPNPQQWDSLFQQAMVSSLAAYLVPALSLSFPLMQAAIATAEKTITIARAVDGNEGVTVMDHLPDWMAARAGAQGWYGYDFTIYGGLVSMPWPVFGE